MTLFAYQAIWSGTTSRFPLVLGKIPRFIKRFENLRCVPEWRTTSKSHCAFYGAWGLCQAVPVSGLSLLTRISAESAPKIYRPTSDLVLIGIGLIFDLLSTLFRFFRRFISPLFYGVASFLLRVLGCSSGVLCCFLRFMASVL